MSNIMKEDTFENKMLLKIKESIGDLITDEELKKLIDSGIQKTFFEKKEVKHTYGKSTFKPSLIEEIITELLKEKVELAVNDWIENNKDEYLDIINKTVENGIGNAVIKAMNNQLQTELITLQQNITNNLVKY